VRRFPGPGDTIAHATLGWRGDTAIILSSVRSDERERHATEPAMAGIYLVLDDTDAHHDRAVAAGAEILRPVRPRARLPGLLRPATPERNVWNSERVGKVDR